MEVLVKPKQRAKKKKKKKKKPVEALDDLKAVCDDALPLSASASAHGDGAAPLTPLDRADKDVKQADVQEGPAAVLDAVRPPSPRVNEPTPTEKEPVSIDQPQHQHQNAQPWVRMQDQQEDHVAHEQQQRVEQPPVSAVEAGLPAEPQYPEVPVVLLAQGDVEAEVKTPDAASAVAKEEEEEEQSAAEELSMSMSLGFSQDLLDMPFEMQAPRAPDALQQSGVVEQDVRNTVSEVLVSLTRRQQVEEEEKGLRAKSEFPTVPAFPGTQWLCICVYVYGKCMYVYVWCVWHMHVYVHILVCVWIPIYICEYLL
jgi:hypothetical protein